MSNIVNLYFINFNRKIKTLFYKNYSKPNFISVVISTSAISCSLKLRKYAVLYSLLSKTFSVLCN